MGFCTDTQTSDTTDYGNTSGDGQDLHMLPASTSYRNYNGTSGTDRDYEGFLSDIRIVTRCLHSLHSTNYLTNKYFSQVILLFFSTGRNNLNLNGDTTVSGTYFSTFNSLSQIIISLYLLNNTKSVSESLQWVSMWYCFEVFENGIGNICY